MDHKNLLIAGSLTGVIILLIGIFIILPISKENALPLDSTNYTFDNSTPETTAISIAKLNDGAEGFGNTVNNVYLTPDKKYWIVNMSEHGDYGGVVTVNAKTWMSKKYDEKWRSLDELKAQYIADIQKDRTDGSIGGPSKVTIDGKEIWKVPVYKFNYDHNKWEQSEYIYVDVKTGKSKNTWNEFNKAAGTDGWLTLKEVDNTINKIYDWGSTPFKDALRDLYRE